MDPEVRQLLEGMVARMDEAQERLLREVLEVKGQVEIVRAHVFNGLTHKVEEMAAAAREHPRSCPFPSWLKEHQEANPELTAPGVALRRRRADRAKRGWRVVAYVVAGVAGAATITSAVVTLLRTLA